ncbi:hypothetical protein L1987_27686 [Smallanthus sonchifolius]|uniref:Uncharacterized protein n=1 Tax=Smallanthus sonchifolius TaxID=185202 RepID=A0ACB9IBH9_9ASTR|nr:hypothetical protein L1987_27686 [Smallanthus sonchifolius]
METSINIGFACSLLRQGMKQIFITVESPKIVAAEKADDKNDIAKVSKTMSKSRYQQRRLRLMLQNLKHML